MSTATVTEIKLNIEHLSDTDQEKVLSLVRGLRSAETPRAMTGAEFVQSLPVFTEQEAREMQEAIEEWCETPPLGESGTSLIRCLPRFTPDEVLAMEKAIEEGCEQVNPDEW